MMNDVDRARFFIEKDIEVLLSNWKNLTHFSDHAKHLMIQKIMKNYELKQFISIMKKENIATPEELGKEALDIAKQWLSRKPHIAFDSLSHWDDINHSRVFFLGKMKEKFPHFERELNRSDALKEICSLVNAQTAQGAL